METCMARAEAQSKWILRSVAQIVSDKLVY
uniref:Uncharacterized protein n=1 Tax=Arundo donax TaxID=35708 RepID=A0A0A8YI80_ARUDO